MTHRNANLSSEKKTVKSVESVFKKEEKLNDGRNVWERERKKRDGG